MLKKDAIISKCKAYRYGLSRIWDDRKPMLLWIMLNPSKADHRKDDRTIRRLYDFTAAEGCGGFYVINLFAFRSKNPEDLLNVNDPIGDENDYYLFKAIDKAHKIVCAWGANGHLFDRDATVLEVLAGLDLYCLGTTKKGLPRHPLMVSGKTPLISFNQTHV